MKEKNPKYIHPHELLMLNCCRLGESYESQADCQCSDGGCTMGVPSSWPVKLIEMGAYVAALKMSPLAVAHTEHSSAVRT